MVSVVILFNKDKTVRLLKLKGFILSDFLVKLSGASFLSCFHRTLLFSAPIAVWWKPHGCGAWWVTEVYFGVCLDAGQPLRGAWTAPPAWISLQGANWTPPLPPAASTTRWDCVCRHMCRVRTHTHTQTALLLGAVSDTPSCGVEDSELRWIHTKSTEPSVTRVSLFAVMSHVDGFFYWFYYPNTCFPGVIGTSWRDIWL